MPVSKAAAQLRNILKKPEPPPITQQSLAKDLGVTQQAVSSWLRGVTRPEYETRQKIQKQVGVPVDDWKVDVEDVAEDGAVVEDAGSAPDVSAAEPTARSA